MKTFLVLLLSVAAFAESAPTTLGRVVQFHSQNPTSYPTPSRVNFNGVLGDVDGGLYTQDGTGWTRICTWRDGCDAGVKNVTGTSPVVVTPTAGVYDVSLGTVPVTKGGTNLTSTADDSIPVGATASSYVTTLLPACANGPLSYDTSTNTFNCPTLQVSKGGTALTSTADDSFALGSGVSTYVTTTLPSCSASTSALAYNTGTNAFSCNTIPGAATVTSVTGTSPISVTPTGTVYNVALGTVPVSKGGTGITFVASNQLLVGSGASYILSTLPNVPAEQYLSYSTGTGLFTAPILNRIIWSNFCPSGVTCNDQASPMLGFIGDKSSNWTLKQVSCSASTAGTGAGNMTVHVYDVTGAADLDTCTISCTSVTQTGAKCSLSATMTATREYRVYTTGCTTLPLNQMCNITLTP